MILVVRFKSVPGKRAELAAVIGEAVALAHPHGCTAHRVATSQGDSDTILLYEEWTSTQAHADFMQSGTLSPYMPRMGEFMAAPPEMAQYDVVDAVPPLA